MNRLFGPIPAGAVHLVVDMQELFRSHPDWGSAALSGIVTPIRRLLEARPDNAYFSRFVPPSNVEQAAGAWRRYYRRWGNVTLERMNPSLIEIVDELRPWARRLVDKNVFSVLSNAEFQRSVQATDDRCLIVSGFETDVCVLSTVMDAVDLGWRVILAVDAVSSASSPGHESALQILHDRFDEQVEMASVQAILTAWQQGAAA